MRLILVVLLLLSGAARPVLSQTPEADYRAVFSLDALGLPRPSAGLATSFSLGYRGLMPNAAFAVARDAAGRSAWGYAGGAATPAQAEAAALDRCRGSLNGLQAECRILLRNLDVVGPDLAPAAVPLATGSLGPFRWSPLHLRRGPQAAKGVVIWAHGYAGADRDMVKPW